VRERRLQSVADINFNHGLSMPRTEFSASSLNHLRHQLDAWRRSQPGRTRLPEEVSESATSLARTQGVSSVARTLRLDYYQLQRRLKRRRSSATKPSRFLEVVPPPLPVFCGNSCTVELSDEPGGKMTVQLADHGSALLALAEAFWRQPR